MSKLITSAISLLPCSFFSFSEIRLLLYDNATYHLIRLIDLMYVERSGDYCDFTIWENGKPRRIVLEITLTHTQEFLSQFFIFSRIFNSHIISLLHIKTIDNKIEQVTMNDDKQLNIGGTFQQCFANSFEPISAQNSNQYFIPFSPWLAHSATQNQPQSQSAGLKPTIGMFRLEHSCVRLYVCILKFNTYSINQ